MNNKNKIFPRSSIIGVNFEAALPCEATKQQILEWISHNLGLDAISPSNPLHKHELEAIVEPILTDTRLFLHQKAERTEKGWTIHSWKDHKPFTDQAPIDAVLGSGSEKDGGD
jgi:hypothetical protein